MNNTDRRFELSNGKGDAYVFIVGREMVGVTNYSGSRGRCFAKFSLPDARDLWRSLRLLGFSRTV